VIAEFPLAEDVVEVRRGIPYGFAHSGWARPNPELPGWNKVCFRQACVVEDTWIISWGLCRDDERVRASG
jgi:hypothetical protein